MENINNSIHYIRKNRKESAMIYLKDNDNKIAQKLFCYIYAHDNKYEIVGETTNLEEVKNCNLILIASKDIFAKDDDEYCKIKNKLQQKNIRTEIAVNMINEKEYITRALDLFKKV